jgi:outer membrane PBP1 activator LpoA protein
VYDGIPNASYDRDLNGVRFLAIPWSVTPTTEQQQLRRELQNLWPSNFRNNSKLYGLGIDSLKLMRHLTRMQLFPEIALDGVTGKLTLNTDHTITQRMLWAKFVDGNPQVLAPKNKALYGE